MKKYIYADNAATTKISDKVLNAMMPYLQNQYGNASSIYTLGNDSEKAILETRTKISEMLNCQNGRIFFTSGGTESNNWAIKGCAYSGRKKGKTHIITTNFEHHAVLHTTEYLAKNGFDITYIPVDKNGLVEPEQIKKAIRKETALVTIMFANNEIGTILPIAEIGTICREHKIPFHTDAVQAIGNVEINAEDMNIDMMSISGHKVGAMKGIGALYVRNGILLENLMHGGGQEWSKRPGTENVAGIVGMGIALELACSEIREKQERLTKIRDKIIDGLLNIKYARLNGCRKNRLCGNINMSFVGAEGEYLLLNLDNKGILASSGSACTTGSLDPSHVLLAIGATHEVAHGSLRLSLSKDITDEEVNYIMEIVPKVVEKVRMMSPLWDDIEKNSELRNRILAE